MYTVLIVDDSAVMRLMMKSILMNNGFEVIGEAGTGKAGVKKYKELSPDLVTMDVTMDEMSGIEALSRIMGVNPDANVVMVSSMGQGTIIRDAMMLGAKGFILKPFEEQQILSTVNKLFITQ